MTTRLSVIALLFATGAAVLVGQGRELPQLPDPFPQRPPTPTFRSGIDLVQVDAYVTDENGKPVTGLTADDFEVFEDGKPQVITTFTPVNIPIEQSEALPFDAEPDVLSNNRPPGHLYLIIMAGTAPDWALRARYLARRFINEYFGDNDVAALITGRTFPGDRQDFTSSRRLLISAVDRFDGGAIDVVELADLMEMFARMPGSRKVAVWFGGAPPVEVPDPFSLDRTPLLYTRAGDAGHAALAAAMRGNIRWYRIDPEGLTPAVAPDRLAGETAPGPPGPGSGGGNPYSVFDTTGGFSLVNSNNFTNAFERLVAETSTYYLLGFESSHRRAEGRLVKLEVKTKRPDLKVRSRTGYIEEFRYKSRPPYVEPQRTPVEAALANPMATSGMGMRVTAAPFKSSGRDATVTLAVDLDASELAFNDTNGSFTGTLELRHLAIDVNHKIYPEFRHTSTMTLDAANLERLRASGVRIVSQFDVPKGRYQVRVAATSGGWNGSVVYDVEVPDFTADPLALSGVALAALAPAATATLRPSTIKRTSQKSRQCRAASCEASVVMESRLTAWSADVEKTGAHILRDVLPAPPTTTREFAPEETLALYAEVYDNNRAADKEAPYAIRLTATLRAPNGSIVREISDERSSRAPRRPSGGHGFTLHVPLAAAAPGQHLLQVDARSDRNPSQVVTRRIPIRLLSR
jgi:VWFA-related protein